MYLIPNLFVHRRSSAFLIMKQTAHHVPADSFSQQKGLRLQPPHVFICLRDCLSKSCVYVSISCSQHRRTMLKDTLMGAKTHCHSCTVRPTFNCVLPGVTKRTRTTPAASLYPPPPPPPLQKKKKKKKKKKKLTSRVEIEAAVVIVLMASVDVKQHWTWTVKRLL